MSHFSTFFIKFLTTFGLCALLLSAGTAYSLEDQRGPYEIINSSSILGRTSRVIGETFNHNNTGIVPPLSRLPENMQDAAFLLGLNKGGEEGSLEDMFFHEVAEKLSKSKGDFPINGFSKIESLSGIEKSVTFHLPTVLNAQQQEKEKRKQILFNGKLNNRKIRDDRTSANLGTSSLNAENLLPAPQNSRPFDSPAQISPGFLKSLSKDLGNFPQGEFVPFAALQGINNRGPNPYFYQPIPLTAAQKKSLNKEKVLKLKAQSRAKKFKLKKALKLKMKTEKLKKKGAIPVHRG